MPQIVEKSLNSRKCLLTRASVSCKKTRSLKAHSGAHAFFYETPRGLFPRRVGEKKEKQIVSSESFESLHQRLAARSLKKN
jgi:hypothetical protein